MATLVPPFEGAEVFYEMSANLHKKLNESFSFDNVWRGLRAELFPKLFGKKYDIIKTTTDANFYRPFSTYTDAKSEDSKPCSKKTKRYLGNFKEMIQVEPMNYELAHQALTVQEDHRFPVVRRCHYHLRGVRSNKAGAKVSKEIVVQFGGLRKFYTCMPLLLKGDVRVDTKFAAMKLFVVHELFAVDQMWISVHGDMQDSKDRRKWEIRETMPIAVRFREYKPKYFT